VHFLEHKAPALNEIGAACMPFVFLAEKALVGRARDEGDQIFWGDGFMGWLRTGDPCCRISI
ncbi:hypothetical protein ABTN26_18965, partial [Acinetobacter baumannii]